MSSGLASDTPRANTGTSSSSRICRPMSRASVVGRHMSVSCSSFMKYTFTDRCVPVYMLS
jgi:hypothetical protein